MPRQARNTATASAVKTEAVQAAETAQPIQVKANPLTLNTYVTVKNGFNGKLVYKSRKTGEKFVWSEFGAEQDMELAELKNAKNSSKAFFVNNWFLFDDPDVIEFLGVERMYKNALMLNEFDDLFKKTPAEIKRRIAELSEGQKYSLRYCARQKIKNGEIDSIKVIAALEEALDTELVEK